MPFAPVAETASGGELSRIALAIAAVAGGETMVFDEIDAGIGGVTAHAVGETLRRLAERTGHATDDGPGQQLDEVHRALADRLDDEADRAGLPVDVGDGQRDALRAGSEMDDDELARLDEEAEQEHASIEHANLLAEEAELQLDELSLALEQAQVRRLDAETGLTLARTRSRELERHAQEARFALSTAQNRLNELEHRRDDLSERRDTLNERQENLVIEQDSLIQSDLDELLQSALIVRDAIRENPACSPEIKALAALGSL